MNTKAQIQARFEQDVLGPLTKNYTVNEKELTLEIVSKAWASFMKMCFELGDINQHQLNTWVLPEGFSERYG